MDRFLDEDNPMPTRDRSASPIHSLLYGDPKRHHSMDMKAASSEEIAAALEMVQKVVDPNTVFSPIKLNPELHTGTTTTISINAELREGQSAENIVHIANFTPASSNTMDESVTDSVSVDNSEPVSKKLKTEPDKNVAVKAANLGESNSLSTVKPTSSKTITATGKLPAETENGSNHVGNVELSISSSINSVHNISDSDLKNNTLASDASSRPAAESVAQ